jgi:hypothetical protein
VICKRQKQFVRFQLINKLFEYGKGCWSLQACRRMMLGGRDFDDDFAGA